MNNRSSFAILAGLVILNLIIFLLVNLFLDIPLWLNGTMVAVEVFCLLLTIVGRMKSFKHIDATIGIILNIFLTMLLIGCVIIYKSRS